MDNNQPFTHVLQKKGILKSFTVAKIVNGEDIQTLKSLIKAVASSKEEYETLLKEELMKLSNMHDEKNPIPGIIYPDETFIKRQLLFMIAHKICENVKKQGFARKELAFLISAMVNKFELNQEDFVKLNEELEKEQEEDNE